jgi:hypothetical protein
MSADYATTRHSLHGVAELVLAGPRYDAGGSMRLRAGADGIRAWENPLLLLTAGEVVAGQTRVPLAGSSYADVAAALGLAAHPLDDVYHDGPHVSPAETITLEPAHAQTLLDALARGDQALRSFAPDSEPVLWPEHFDVAITLDAVNYGVSPGDGYLERPYAYVGPHQQLTGDFWNAPFGAAHPLEELADSEELVGFFRRGRDQAGG